MSSGRGVALSADSDTLTIFPSLHLCLASWCRSCQRTAAVTPLIFFLTKNPRFLKLLAKNSQMADFLCIASGFLM